MGDTLVALGRVLLVAISAFTGLFTFGVVAVILIRVRAARACGRRVADGEATVYDLDDHVFARYGIRMTDRAAIRLTCQPGLGCAWVAAGEPWDFLEDCYAAGLTDAEIHAHLHGTGRVTREQVRLLLALNGHDPHCRRTGYGAA